MSVTELYNNAYIYFKLKNEKKNAFKLANREKFAIKKIPIFVSNKVHNIDSDTVV